MRLLSRHQTHTRLFVFMFVPNTFHTHSTHIRVCFPFSGKHIRVCRICATNTSRLLGFSSLFNQTHTRLLFFWTKHLKIIPKYTRGLPRSPYARHTKQFCMAARCTPALSSAAIEAAVVAKLLFLGSSRKCLRKCSKTYFFGPSKHAH